MEPASGLEMYASLWDDFLTNILLPEFRRRYLEVHAQTHSNIKLTPQLWLHRFDANVYPFIHDRVKKFMESMCDKFLLRASCDINKHVTVEKMWTLWSRIVAFDEQIILQTLSPLKSAFVAVTSGPTISTRAMVKEVFRRCIYYKVAPVLREEAFQAISDDFKVKDNFSLGQYFRFIQELGEDKVAFVKEEWDGPLHEKTFKGMKKSISKWSKTSMPEFLENVSTLLEECNKMFFCFTGDIEKAVMKEIRTMRDVMLFQDSGELFEKMIMKTRYSETLKNLFDQFHDDSQFLDSMAYLASEFYSGFIYGECGTNSEMFKCENTFKKLLLIWFRIHKALVQQKVKRMAVHEALVDPFLAFTNSAAHYPEAIVEVLSELFDTLLSKSRNRHQKMEHSSLEKLLAVSSLSCYLPPAEPFPKILRSFLSKFLLQFSSTHINIGMLSAQNVISSQNEGIKELFLMLKDAGNWDLYRSEMAPVIQQSREGCEGTQIDLRLVRRSLWELGTDVNIMLPRNVQSVSDKIVQEFESRYPMRSISIHPLVGQMIIRTNVWTYDGNGIKIMLSTGQGCVLAKFGRQEISLRDLAVQILVNRNEVMGLPALVAILKSLMIEHQILKKKPENEDFCETDTFFLNLQFQPMSDFIELPEPEYPQEIYESSTKNAVNHLQGIDLEQVVRAAVMKVLKQERELEMDRMRNIVVGRLGRRYDLSQFNFDEVVTKLEDDEYLTVDKSIVRYIV